MRLIREPLFHFLILGAVIFAVHGLTTRHQTDKPGEIVVTQTSIENLVTGFTRTWQRPPTEDELHGLVRDYIREEAAYREALALGLDRDDMIVRRVAPSLDMSLARLSFASTPAPGRGGLEAVRATPRLYQLQTQVPQGGWSLPFRSAPQPHRAAIPHCRGIPAGDHEALRGTRAGARSTTNLHQVPGQARRR